MEKKIRIGLYGANGHQIHKKLINHPNAQLVAVCKMDEQVFSQNAGYNPDNIKFYDKLEDMLADGNIDLISLCSPKRKDQARDAIMCLNAHKHVYAEKPAALSFEELDTILDAAKRNNCCFHEFADTVFYEPYWSLKKIISSGAIGEVVQVYVQKSYSLRANARPQDEVTDGGLIRWVGIHAVRFIEHITGIKVKDVKVFQTHKGNIDEIKGLYTASSWAMTLENGGVASACVNYLNPRGGFGRHGNESVRIFGTEGMAEITDGGTRSHVYTLTENLGEINCESSDCEDFFDIYMEHLSGKRPMPMSLEDEIHPLKVVIKAFETAETIRCNCDD